MSDSANKKDTNPRNYDTSEERNPPTPAEFVDAVFYWLRHWWEAPREKSKAADWVVAGLTIAIGIAAFWSAHIFQGQLIEARRATSLASESFRIDERAWVEIEPVKPTSISSPDDKFPAGFSCSIYPKNVGKTVARDIRVKAVETIRTGEFSLSEMQSLQGMLPKAKKYTVNIGTSQTTESVADRFPSNPVPKVLSPNTVASAPFRLGCQATKDYPSGGHAYSFIVGRIDYCDAFRVRHWKTFCFFVANARGDVWNCQEGNDEDRNPEAPTPETTCAGSN